MPVSKTLPLERRIQKLEQEVAAYKRQLQKNDAGGTALAREVSRRLSALRATVGELFDAAEACGFEWDTQPKPLRLAAEKLADAAIDDRMSAGVCRVCGCTDDDCSQCVEKTGAPCRWVEPDLCSACAPATNPKTPKPPRTTKRTPR